ncbi:MAG: AglZ/HisF2 family acetamidino modification protein [Chitinophagales bacterium]|nr:AglZ/HisF2 family acetamidino modification protein [Chitinophagales bacterium]
MFRPRVIPVLLIDGDHLVKSVGFKNYRYIGDPINAVRIFNELQADELVFLDISATRNRRVISLDLVKNIGEEANMPFCVGGGICEISQIREILSAGAEKVVIGTHAILDPDFIRRASDEFGSSSITVCIDVKKRKFGKEQVWTFNGSRPSGFDPLEFAQIAEKNGAGEIIVQSIENDGKMNGYNLELIKQISKSVLTPVIALGGAGNIQDFKRAYREASATGLAAGSFFVFYGNNKGVLINYPEKQDLKFLYES